MKFRITTAVLLVSIARVATAQCTSFVDAYEALPGLSIGGPPEVRAVARFDDGSGPAIFVAGSFLLAGDVAVSSLAKWDGAQWSSPFAPGSPGVDGLLYALETWNDGTGEALYVGGFFEHVDGVAIRGFAKWNGSTWSSLGSGLTPAGFAVTPWVRDALVWDDGTGEALYVGGSFATASGAIANGIAKWDGSTWSSFGTGVDGTVFTLAVFDAGSGPKLHVAGAFNTAGGVTCKDIARWDGSGWSALGPGITGNSVDSLAVFDDGTGAALYACGPFSAAGPTSLNQIGRWKNHQWSTVAGNPFAYFRHVAAYDDGSGAALYSIAQWPSVPSGYHMRKLVGSSWVEVGGLSDSASCLQPIDTGAGADLYLGGRFDRAGDVMASRVASYDGQWHSLGGGGGLPNAPEALAVLDVAGSAVVYADSGQSSFESVVRWTGTSWAPLGVSSDDEIHALAWHDDGSGPRLYAAGDFTYFGTALAAGVARFDGSAWNAVGTATMSHTDPVWALQSWASAAGPRLVAGGEFTNLGNTPLGHIGLWDGVAWTAMNGGLVGNVLSLGVFNGDLYAGGDFTGSLSGTPANHIARWDGSQWSALGSGVNAAPFAMVSFDDGTGPALYVGGDFTTAGGATAKYIARWNGSQWSALGAGMSSWVNELAVFDDGTGPKLFAGGVFTTAGGAPAKYLARWDGANWSQVDATLNAGVTALAVANRANGESSLFLGGSFTTAGGARSVHVAEYARSFPCAPLVYCTAKTNSLGCVPAIGSSGTPSLASSTLVVSASQVVSNKNGVMFWGFAPSASPFQGGIKCIHAPTLRTPFQNSGGNLPPDDCSGTFAFAFDSSYMAASGLAAGDRVYCQYWSRDPASPSTTNLTNALTFLVAP